MGTLQTDIQQKQKEIEQHQQDLSALYADLGYSVALIEQIGTIGYGRQQFLLFLEEQERYLAAKHSYEMLATYITQLEDRSRKIKQIEADIHSLSKMRKRLYAQIGAIAYEAYGSQNLPDHVIQVCSPFFEEQQKKTRRLEEQLEKRGTSVLGNLLRFQLDLERKRLLPLLAKAGKALVAIGCERDLKLETYPELKDQLSDFQIREKELKQELEVHQSAIAKLQTQEVQSPKARLEQHAQAMKQAQKVCEKTAEQYGKVLYEDLPENVDASLIGHKAIQLMDQITLHRKRVRQLEKSIQVLQNLMQVQEIEAQIELENQKIGLLRTQIDQCNRQIAQVDASIAEKRKTIVALLPDKEVSIDG